MKNLLPIVLFLTLVLISCEKKSDNLVNFCSDLVINYNQQSSWTGWRYNLTITYPDTLTIYERTFDPIIKEITSKYHIDKNTMDSLFLDLQKLSKTKLDYYYGFGPEKPTDLPMTSFKFKNCNSLDSCLIYSPDKNEVPTELLSLLGRINRIIFVQHNLINMGQNHTEPLLFIESQYPDKSNTR